MALQKKTKNDVLSDCVSQKKTADIALAGNPNTGKSTLFNALTGVGAAVSNCPGTSVDILEGKTNFEGKKLSIIDLPGVYSISDLSEDEKVTKDFLTLKKPKVIINVVDATLLERNLYLTLQLLSLNTPIVVALNFYNEAKKKGIIVDYEALSNELGVPVVKISALRGQGIEKLIKESVNHMGKANNQKKKNIDFKKESLSVESSEKRHKKCESIASKVITKKYEKKRVQERLEELTTHPIFGFGILFLVFGLIFFSLFVFGGYLASLINNLFTNFVSLPLKHAYSGINLPLLTHIFDFAIDGVNAGLQIALPYILVFYIIFALLEDSGYLSRIAYLLDRFMHHFKLHGKSIIPIILGFGCTVPAILATRMLPTKKERIITSVLVNLIPCSARTAVIIGAAGRFIGWKYALLIYLIVLTLVVCIGLILSKILPGESTGLILEMPTYRLPVLSNIIKKTWGRLKEFFVIAFPMIIIGSIVLGILDVLNLLPIIVKPFDFLISGWLFLPSVTAITLIYGVLRKELALEMLFLLSGGVALNEFLTPLQIFTFTIVVTLYFPCIATFAVLKREFGYKVSILIALGTSAIAIFLGGLIARIMIFFNILA